jgi:hypothetical protein
MMIAVAVAAALVACALEIARYRRMQADVVVIDDRRDPDGSGSFTLLHHYTRTYYVGPIPIGPYPTVVLISVVAGSALLIGAWYRRPGRRPSGVGEHDRGHEA